MRQVRLVFYMDCGRVLESPWVVEDGAITIHKRLGDGLKNFTVGDFFVVDANKVSAVRVEYSDD